MVTSPDPLMPPVPFRQTKARSVDGFVPPCLRRRVGPSCQTPPGPVGTMAEDGALLGGIKEGTVRKETGIEFGILDLGLVASDRLLIDRSQITYLPRPEEHHGFRYEDVIYGRESISRD